jgi:alkylation response protein AidB-like acyl-CoA dehydrogenase
MSEPMPKDYGFGSDEEMLRDLAKKLLDEEMPIEKLRRLVAADPETTYEEGQRPGWDETLWKQCVELGWTGLAVPEDAGGVGITMVGIAALVEEVGRHCLPSPLVATLNATYVLREAAGDAAQNWLGRIADGTTAALAVTDATGAWEPNRTDIEASDANDGANFVGLTQDARDRKRMADSVGHI